MNNHRDTAMSVESHEGESVAQLLWHFSLRYYRQPRIAETCIELQDKAGVDVNILLFLLWQATQEHAVSIEDIRQIQQLVAFWHLHVVTPLRTARRAVKQSSASATVFGADTIALSKEILAVELKAERRQQDAIFRFSADRSWRVSGISCRDTAAQNVRAYQSVLLSHFSAVDVNILLEGLSAWVNDTTSR